MRSCRGQRPLASVLRWFGTGAEEEATPVLLDQEGVYGWGHSDRGQLGQGKQSKLMKKISLLDFASLPGLQHVRAQEEGSVFITRSQERNCFFGTGDGTSGASGFQEEDPIFTPIPFQGAPASSEEPIETEAIIEVSCGRFHTLYRTGEAEFFFVPYI
jgi:alpha-tubulin suppressor-like RCC1 family protein